jgi:ABC-2 type transport system ATP-binding protein
MRGDVQSGTVEQRESAIQVVGLTRDFTVPGGTVRALDEISFSVPAGQCIAVLGVNGAGKTTLAKVLSTLLLPTAGTARVFGHDVVGQTAEVRGLLSVVLGGDRGLYSMLTGAENLAYFGMLAGIRRHERRSRVPELLRQVGLREAADRRVETYSKGMKQRLHIAAGLIAEPRVLLLDEPTVGLDPNEAARLRDQIAALRASGVTILLTSHYLVDVEQLAERVIMVSAGRLTHDMGVREFAESVGYAATVRMTIAGDAPIGLVDAVSRVPGVKVAYAVPSADDRETVLTALVEQWDPLLLTALGTALGSIELIDMTVRQASLDEAFAAMSEVTG